MRFSPEPPLWDVPYVDGAVFMVASVQEDHAGEDEQQGTQQQQHFHGALATVHKISVEHVRVLSARQTVL